MQVSWGDVDGGEATGPFVAPLARSCISVASDALPKRRAGASPRPSPPRAPRGGAHRATTAGGKAVTPPQSFVEFELEPNSQNQEFDQTISLRGDSSRHAG